MTDSALLNSWPWGHDLLMIVWLPFRVNISAFELLTLSKCSKFFFPRWKQTYRALDKTATFKILKLSAIKVYKIDQTLYRQTMAETISLKPLVLANLLAYFDVYLKSQSKTSELIRALFSEQADLQYAAAFALGSDMYQTPKSPPLSHGLRRSYRFSHFSACRWSKRI